MFLVGRIVGTFGNKGEVKVQSLMNPPDFLLEMDKLYIESEDGSKQGFSVTSARRHKNIFVFHFENVDNMDIAEAIIGYSVYVPSIEVKDLQANEYYYHQLQGMKVYSEDGDEVGTLDHIIQGAGDILVIKNSDDKEIMVPFVDEFVTEINLEEKTLTVNMMEGLAQVNDEK